MEVLAAQVAHSDGLALRPAASEVERLSGKRSDQWRQPRVDVVGVEAHFGAHEPLGAQRLEQLLGTALQGESHHHPERAWRTVGQVRDGTEVRSEEHTSELQ